MFDALGEFIERFQTLIVAFFSAVIGAVGSTLTAQSRMSRRINKMDRKLDEMRHLIETTQTAEKENKSSLQKHTGKDHEKLRSDCRADWEKSIDGIKEFIHQLDSNHHYRVEELKDHFKSVLSEIQKDIREMRNGKNDGT